MTASISAISWGLTTLDIWGKIPWSVIALIMFIIFAIIMFCKVYDLERQIKKLTGEDAQLERQRKQLEIENFKTNKQRLEFEQQRGKGGYLDD